MAGIGFELRKHLRKDTYLGLLRAYAVAALVGSGPWLVSIGGTIATGFLALSRGAGDAQVTLFFASVTHLMATSLITSGALQLLFTRFVADRLFEKRRDLVVPNLLGALLVTTAATGVLGVAVAWLAFQGNFAYRALLVGCFVLLNDVWLLSVFLSGLKAYRLVVLAFAIAYSSCFLLAGLLASGGVLGLLSSFFIGHGLLMILMLFAVVREHPGEIRLAFDFLDRGKVYPILAGAGVLYNLGSWIDKFVFWQSPLTSSEVLGPLRASLIYDTPIFLAYLTVVPGMAIFLVRIETDFAESYDRFFDAVRNGTTLATLERLRDAMVTAARDGLYDIFRVQGLTAVGFVLVAPRVLDALGQPRLYVPLLDVLVVGAGIQVVYLGVLTILFYLDYRTLAFVLNAVFAVSNFALTVLTLRAGSRFYGYGFAVSLLVTVVLGLVLLSRKLDRLEYDTFMR